MEVIGWKDSDLVCVCIKSLQNLVLDEIGLVSIKLLLPIIDFRVRNLFEIELDGKVKSGRLWKVGAW